LFQVKFYSYLSALKVFIFEIAIAGKYEAIAETVSDKTNIIKIEKKLISLGSFSKK
jgi:hypothetical protein